MEYICFYCDVTMMLLHSQSISYFNVIVYIWLKSYQNGNQIEPSEQRLPEISIVENSCTINFCNTYFLHPLFWWLYMFVVLVAL